MRGIRSVTLTFVLGVLLLGGSWATPASAGARVFGGALSNSFQAGPDPSLVGDWAVSSMCSGSPCGDSLDISIGGQPSDPYCAAGVYCITDPSGFYGKSVSLTPNGGGSWIWTCTGCTPGYYNEVSVQFGVGEFKGTATSYADGSATGTVPYDGTCTNCTAATYVISGKVSSHDCTSTCLVTPQGVPGVTIDVASNDGHGISTSDVSDKFGNWSVTVPPGGYTVTPQGNAWTPASLDETVASTDVPNVNFSECSSATSDDVLRWSGPLASAAGAGHCINMTLKCLNATLPTPAVCVVTTTDITQNPTPPTGKVGIQWSLVGHSDSAFYQSSCTLISHQDGGKSSSCTDNYAPVGEFDGPDSPKVTLKVTVVYEPPGVSDRFLSASAYVTVSPEPSQPEWSSAGGKNILKYWSVAEGGGYIATKAVLDSAKTTEAAAKLVGPEAVAGLSGATKFIVGKANPYLYAVGTGLQIAAWGDAAYAVFIDPIDPHYKVVAKPEPMRAPTVTVANDQDQRMLNSFLNNVEMQHAITTVLGITEDRATSAHEVGDKHAYQLQERAISRYLDELASLTDAQLASQIAIERVLTKMLTAAHIGPIFSLPQVPHASYAAEVALDPQTLEQAQLLLSVGATNSYVANLETVEEDARIPARIDLLTDIVSPAMIRDERNVAEMLRAEALKVPL